MTALKYFTNNCKANLNIWSINFFILNEEYLFHVNNYQKVHNSLELFGMLGDGNNLTNEELEIIDLLKNQGVEC